MMDINSFYNAAECGEPIDRDKFRQYINAFDNVIIWGAGNLGQALGKYFTANKIKLTAYWDIRHRELQSVEGVPVSESFTGNYEKDKTIVIIGIVNGTLSHLWQEQQLKEKGYFHYLLGMQTYEAVVCPLEKGKPFQARECVSTSICNFNTCKRYMNIFQEGKKKTGICIQVLEIIVSARCTLDCRQCGQQVGVTKRKFPEKYQDYPLSQIKKDIDAVMGCVDAVGTFSVIGGEPFIHPDIVQIIRHCLSKDNIAIISITTNGICKLTEDMLKQMKDERVKINFSNYTEVLGEKERALFHENVDKVKKAGISCNVSTPIWNEVNDELKENTDFRDETLDARKERCVFGPSVANGILYACPQTERQARNELHDVTKDTIDLNREENLEEALRQLINRCHYETCKFICTNGKESRQVPPGEQWEDI